MTYKKAELEVTLFDVEDIITTSGGVGIPPYIPDSGPEIPPVPQPPVPQPGDGGDDSAN